MNLGKDFFLLGIKRIVILNVSTAGENKPIFLLKHKIENIKINDICHHFKIQ